jgi:hypothetical protein
MVQRGGFDITTLKDSDFKYTIDPDRILWTKNIFPIADYLIDAVLNIPWKSYKFEGDSKFWVVKETAETGRFQVENEKSTDYIPVLSKVKAVTHAVPYYFFGGCVYEILDRLYGKEAGVPKLREFVDPTGDLDVYLRLPKVTNVEIYGKTAGNIGQDDLTPYLFEEGPPEVVNDPNTVTENTYQNRPGRKRETKNCPIENSIQTSKDMRTYNALIEHYTTWIMEKLAFNLLKYKQSGTLWDSLFGNTIPFSIDEDAEGMFADKIICIGNLKIVRSFLPYMSRIKIQLIAKFPGMNKSDHICEFLLAMPNTFVNRYYSQYGNNENFEQVQKGIPFSAFFELIQGNEDGASNRMQAAKTRKRHKFYNHIMRMAYLSRFFDAKVNKINERNKNKISMKVHIYAQTMGYLNEYLLFVFDFYFNNTYFFILDYKMIDSLDEKKIENLRRNETTIRKKKELFDYLIGNFPSFMMELKYGSYFFTGGTSYINLLEHTKIQQWIQSTPSNIKQKLTIYEMNETLAINANRFYNLLKEMKVITF